MLLGFAHNNIGNLHFRPVDAFPSGPYSIRGAECFYTDIFLGHLEVQEYLLHSNAIVLTSFCFAANACLNVELPGKVNLLCFVLQGMVSIETEDGKVFPLAKGQYWLAEHTHYRLLFNESSSPSLLWVVVAADMITEFSSSYLVPRNKVLNINPVMKALLEELLRNEFIAPVRSLFYEKIILELVFELVRMVPEGKLFHEQQIPPYIAAAIDFIHRSGEVSFCSLEDLSVYTGYSASALKQGFKKYLGKSPFDYQLALRLEWARDMLMTTDCPVNALHQKAGYTHVAGFIKAFKREYGMSPYQWRLKHRRG